MKPTRRTFQGAGGGADARTLISPTQLRLDKH